MIYIYISTYQVEAHQVCQRVNPRSVWATTQHNWIDADTQHETATGPSTPQKATTNIDKAWVGG